MKLSYGFVETKGYVGAIEAADAMVKAAKVNILKWQKVGGALVTVIIEGDLAACQAAVAAGSKAAESIGQLVTAHVIPRPFSDIHMHLGGGDSPLTERPKSSVKPKAKPSPKQAAQKDELSGTLEAFIMARKNGVTLRQLSEQFGQSSSVLRIELKKLMDEGRIEKVQQRYFKTDKKGK